MTDAHRCVTGPDDRSRVIDLEQTGQNRRQEIAEQALQWSDSALRLTCGGRATKH
jgi:hypothetical protein